MKKNRIYYCILIFVLGFIALVMRDRYSVALFFTFLFLPLLSLAFMIIISFYVKMEQSLPKSYTTKDSPLTVHLNIKNKSFFLCPRVMIFRDSLEDIQYDSDNNYSFFVDPRTERYQEISFRCRYRGSYNVGCKKLQFVDYLKLFRFSKKVNETPTVFVYPAIKSINTAFDFMSQSPQESAITRAYEADNSEMFDFRQYEENDDIRKVHWKLSSKSEELIVKKHIPANNTSAVIALDFTSVEISAEKKKLEDSMAEAAISLIKYYISKGDGVEFVYNNAEMECLKVNSSQSFNKAHYLCASLDFNSTMPYNQLVANFLALNKAVSTLYLLTAFVDSGLYEQIKRAAMEGYPIVVIDFGQEFERDTEESIEDLLKELRVAYLSVGEIVKQA